VAVPQQAESGVAVRDVCRQAGISEATCHTWKRRYGAIGVSELRELRKLREGNARLERLVADLSLDRHILEDVLARKCERATALGDRVVDRGPLV
jgi:putative transposase